MQAVNYTRDFTKLESLVNQLENQTDIIKNVDSWLKEYKVSHHYIIDLSSHHFPFSPSL